MIDKTKISGKQFMFSVACFIQSSSLISAYMVSITLQDSWIIILLGTAICLPLIWLYRMLMVTFPDKNLIQILDEVYGPVIGKVIGIGYLWFFLTLTSLNLTDMGQFVKLTIMVKTPTIILIILCMLVSAWAVVYGIKVVARYSTMFTVVAVVILFSMLILVSNQIKFENFLPVFNQEPMKYIRGTHLILTVPFGEIVAFLMIAPNVKIKRKEVSKYLYGGFLLGAASVLIVVARDIAVLGNTLPMFTLPSLVTLRLVNLGVALSRMEILFMVILIMLLFFRITLLYYITVITIAQLTKLQAYHHIVLATGILVIFYGFTIYTNPIEHAGSAQEFVPFFWAIFEYIIPFMTLILAKGRKLPKAKVKEA